MVTHVASAYEALVRRARSGLYRAGDRFMSNRSVVMRFEVSYQTAHRLLSKMVDDGILQRIDRSGTYLAGLPDKPTSVTLILHPRGKGKATFGGKLMTALRDALDAAKIGCTVTFAEDAIVPPDQLPILWEVPNILRRCLHEHRRAILVNDRPAASLEASVIDSVAIDDFAGGVMAAQYLIRTHASGRLAVIGGPKRDRRSQTRIAGFTSEATARIVHAQDWFEPDGEKAAEKILPKKPQGIFCCNDRLAEGFLRTCAARGIVSPPIVGFDDAPIAEQLGLTTIAIPWEAMAAAVVRLVRDRLAGSDAPATHLLLFPRIVPRVLRV